MKSHPYEAWTRACAKPDRAVVAERSSYELLVVGFLIIVIPVTTIILACASHMGPEPAVVQTCAGYDSGTPCIDILIPEQGSAKPDPLSVEPAASSSRTGIREAESPSGTRTTLGRGTHDRHCAIENR